MEESKLPKMAQSPVHAGFPSPAQDYMSGGIDLNRELVRHPEATFYVRVSGDSMRDAGISDGDVLVVDRSLEPGDGAVAVCCLEGEFLVRYLRFGGKISGGKPSSIVLEAANPAYKPIKTGPGSEFSVWGTVTWIIKKVE
ncbi:MAG: translesion error-prone DNA polymerase V autoproteolytic subunit [Bacteroidales bacterium]|nr:translesion error-prone DNA polymerase V autoproteolytic subunit [Bacteroidales bacterium]